MLSSYYHRCFASKKPFQCLNTDFFFLNLLTTLGEENMDTSNKPPWNPFLCSLRCGAEGYLGNLPADAHYSDGIRLLGPLGVDLKSQAQGGRAGCAVPWLCHCAPQQQLNIWLMWGGASPPSVLPSNLDICCLIHTTSSSLGLTPQNSAWAGSRLLAWTSVPVCPSLPTQPCAGHHNHLPSQNQNFSFFSLRNCQFLPVEELE